MSTNDRGDKGPIDDKKKRTGLLYLLIMAALAAYLVFNAQGIAGFGGKTVTLSTSEFVTAVKAGRVKEATYKAADGTLTGSYWASAKKRDSGADPTKFKSTYVGDDTLSELMADNPKVKYTVDTSQPGMWTDLLITLVPTLMVVGVMLYFLNQMQGQNGKAMGFGKTKAKTSEQTRPKVKFSDVAGIDEAVEELREVRDFLSEPERFQKMGAKIPRGVLLVGPPGTGKTLLAKAVAGEAGVPFFSISGSDFVEMFVGVGASRVRDLFKQAKEAAPCIIFIDEIDAVGRQRGAGLGGGHDEREQTLNQLLVEMDGFSANEGVIVIAATNRKDILDPALLRPGRFDRQIYVGAPDWRGRLAILQVHARKKPLADNVDLSAVAKATAGFTGADLANLLNEGALLAARRGKAAISQQDLETSMIKVIAGPEKKSRVVSHAEKMLTAVHEAGHAICMYCLDSQDPVHLITIIPRAQAGGMTISLPQDDRSYSSRNEMFETIVSFLGGRVAEAQKLCDISTGASNDLQRATGIARDMVAKYGMSDSIGPVSYAGGQEVFIGRDYEKTKPYSEQTAGQIDTQVQKIMREAYQRCEQILRDHAERLDKIAGFLMENENMSRAQFEAVMQDETLDQPKA